MRKLILEEGDYLKGELGHGHERSDRRTDGQTDTCIDGQCSC